MNDFQTTHHPPEHHADDIERMVGRAVLAMPARLNDLKDMLQDIRERQCRLEAKQTLCEQRQDENALERELLVHGLRDALQGFVHERYLADVLKPLCRRLAEAVDYLDMAGSGMSEHEATRRLEAARDELIVLLSDYAVAPIEIQVGDQFDPATMQPKEFILVHHPEHERKVHHVLRRGYRCGEVVLRHACVAVCRFSDPTRNHHTARQGAHS